ncbi:hypothetical protein OSTOST_21876 [Ostertagia ostertagi]
MASSWRLIVSFSQLLNPVLWLMLRQRNLDGESNLKEFWLSGAEIIYDVPNGNIYEFQANAHVILRGARLKNTDNIYGIVLYTGQDTKLFMSSIKRVMKWSVDVLFTVRVNSECSVTIQ